MKWIIVETWQSAPIMMTRPPQPFSNGPSRAEYERESTKQHANASMTFATTAVSGACL
jgi:hypothetical protein